MFCIIIDSITLATHHSNCYREVIVVTVVSCDDPVFRVGFNTAFMSENQLSAENDVTYAVGVQNKFMSVTRFESAAHPMRLRHLRMQH